MATLILSSMEAYDLARVLARHPAAPYVPPDLFEKLAAGEPVTLAGPLLHEAIRFLDGATIELDRTDGGRSPMVHDGIYCPHGTLIGRMLEGGRLGNP